MANDPNVNPVIVSITVAVIALMVSIVNASAGIANFILSRFRLLGVREIECVIVHEGDPPTMTRHFTIDVVGYGAQIWDMEAQVEIVIPDTKRNVERGLSGKIVVGLKPLGSYTNPVNAGQGVTWHMWSQEMLQPDFWKQIQKALPHVPHRNISLCIYCSQQRRLLRRIRHPLFHWKLDTFFEGKMKVKLPHYLNLYLKWKNRRVLETMGRSESVISRSWKPPWKRQGVNQ
jgi:hypothetical protein